jgi:hypothetical protein
VKGNTGVADDVKVESEKVHQANAAVAEDATTDHRKLITGSEDADNAQGDMLEVTLDLRQVGHDPNDVYEVCNLPLLPEVRKQYSSLAQVIWPMYNYTYNETQYLNSVIILATVNWMFSSTFFTVIQYSGHLHFPALLILLIAIQPHLPLKCTYELTWPMLCLCYTRSYGIWAP